MHYLTDVHGPRLTGSPNHKRAAEWAVKQMTEWGFKNGKLEPWAFVNADGTPRSGWLNERFSGSHHLSGERQPRRRSARVDAVDERHRHRRPPFTSCRPPRPTQAELDTWIAETTPTIKGKIVLVGRHTMVAGDDQQAGDCDGTTRICVSSWIRTRRRRQGAGAAAADAADQPPPDPTRLSAAAVNTAVDAMMLAAGVAVRINDAGRDHGQIRAFQNRTYDVTKAPPTVVLRNEDYGRITRILADGTPVKLEFNIVNQTYPEGRTSYNAVAEIPGTDKADEVVMLGGHLDSWHAATGATDNAIGCAVMMEAARILQAIGVKPRRTIRVALWGGEEQGLLGSKAYVEEHFGTFENPKPEFAQVRRLFQRGLRHRPDPRQPASSVRRKRPRSCARSSSRSRTSASWARPRRAAGRTGGTDSTSFNAAGLPGIGLGQDPIEYNTYTWHTNLDTYERIIEDDVKKSAMAIASAVYHLAMRDEMLPRFTKETMPPPTPPPGQGRGRRRGALTFFQNDHRLPLRRRRWGGRIAIRVKLHVRDAEDQSVRAVER